MYVQNDTWYIYIKGHDTHNNELYHKVCKYCVNELCDQFIMIIIHECMIIDSSWNKYYILLYSVWLELTQQGNNG